MVTFIDGPAEGVRLELARAPLYLRAVHTMFGPEGKPVLWDALDKLHDRPEPTENIYVYRLVKHEGSMFICRRGRGKRGGLCQIASYAYVAEQPPYDVLRNNAKWAEWVLAEYERTTAHQPAPPA